MDAHIPLIRRAKSVPSKFVKNIWTALGADRFFGAELPDDSSEID
jgi:hypothetical protein